MNKEGLLEKYEASMKYFVVEMIKKCWENDGNSVGCAESFPLDYIQEKNIGETEEEQHFLREHFLRSLEEDEYITYDARERVVHLLDFMG